MGQGAGITRWAERAGQLYPASVKGIRGERRGNGGPFGAFIFIHDLGKCLGNMTVKFSNDANTGGIQLPEWINIQKDLEKLECWVKNLPAW